MNVCERVRACVSVCERVCRHDCLGAPCGGQECGSPTGPASGVWRGGRRPQPSAVRGPSVGAPCPLGGPRLPRTHTLGKLSPTQGPPNPSRATHPRGSGSVAAIDTRGAVCRVCRASPPVSGSSWGRSASLSPDTAGHRTRPGTAESTCGARAEGSWWPRRLRDRAGPPGQSSRRVGPTNGPRPPAESEFPLGPLTLPLR